MNMDLGTKIARVSAKVTKDSTIWAKGRVTNKYDYKTR
jgi:hypothetical protein